MKAYLFLFILMCSSILFCQSISKKEFKRIINNSMKDYNYRIITDNQDSMFYKTENLKIYNSSIGKSKFQFCRTIEFRFLKNNKANLIDCQNCNEPSFCYVTKKQNIFNYKIDNIGGKLIFKLQNKFYKMSFLVESINNIEFKKNKFSEIIIKRKF
ncbi:hypothetical protein [Empedobacter falsenii]|uniref:hypothetical protein n=2 Tax=Weeksellaceae TaxID=2762318 RepID=UPI003A7F901F